MKNIFYILLLFPTFSCQKEFPAPTDVQLTTVTLNEKWRYQYPENEQIIWVSAIEDRVIYITIKKDIADEIHVYIFSSAGTLLSKTPVTGVELPTQIGYFEKFIVSGDWINISSSFANSLINTREGTYYYFPSYWSSVDSNPFDLYLSVKNTAFFQQKLNSNQIGVYQWDLNTNQKTIIDTLMINEKEITHHWKAISASSTHHGASLSYSHNMIYVKSNYEWQTASYTYGLYGISSDEHWGINTWHKDDIFGGKRHSGEFRAELKVDLIYMYTSSDIYCIDMVQNKLKWHHPLNDYLLSQVKIDNKGLYYFRHNQLVCLNPSNGTTEWSTTSDLSRKALGISQTYLASVDYVKLDKNVFFGSVTNHLKIFDKRNGRLLFSNDNPFGNGITVTDNYRYGMQRPLDLQGNTLYAADDKVFGAFEIHQ